MCGKSSKRVKLVILSGALAVGLSACSTKPEPSTPSRQSLCFDAYRLLVLDPSGRTGPIKGELVTARETIQFACPNPDPSVGFRCWDDGRVGLGFGPRQGHKEPPGEVRLVVWENPRPDEPLDILWSGRDEVLWEGELSTDFLSAPRDDSQHSGCLKSDLTLHVQTPFPVLPEPEPEPEPEIIGPCGPDGGVHDLAPCTRGRTVEAPGTTPDAGS